MRTSLSRSRAWWLCAAAFVLPMSLTVADAQRPTGAAWLIQSLDNPGDRREEGTAILDTPILPGSVIKAVTLVAALEANIIRPDTARMCRRTTTVDGRRYTCAHPDLRRPLTPAEALAHSCNDYFLSLAPRLSRTSVNALRSRVGLPPIASTADFAASLIGLDGPRVTPRALLDSIVRLTGADRRRPAIVAEPARRVLVEGLRGAATYGSASELESRRVPALAKTGTASMPGGGVVGLIVALVPPEAPRQAAIVVAPGAAGRDAASIAGDLLSGEGMIRVGTTSAGGRVRVDVVGIDDYVSRVVAGEGQPEAREAAQRALAIVVRTFALANRGRHQREGFDVCDTTHCQVLRASTAASRRAASATSGVVLEDRGRPATVFHSAWCGGHSERPGDTWPGATNHPFDRFGPDDACDDEPEWSSQVDAADLERALRSAGLKGDRLRELVVVRRSPSGRAVRLRADGFTPAELSAEDFRNAVGRTAGWQLLKSTMFELRRTPRGYVFSGRGFGHGVGLCVIGAGRRAASGATAEQILAFYFPGLRTATYPKESVPLAPATAGDLELALPEAEEGQRTRIAAMLRRARDEIAAAAGVTAPPTIRVTVHPEPGSFARATALPWWTAGATVRAEIALLPVAMLTERGQLERTIRHEVAHVLLDPSLAGKPLWVREGAALYFGGGGAGSARIPEPTPRRPNSEAACPTDAELRRATSQEEQRAAYARAEACFRRQLAGGVPWRQVG